jgi:hypothetical protein
MPGVFLTIRRLWSATPPQGSELTTMRWESTERSDSAKQTANDRRPTSCKTMKFVELSLFAGGA